MTDKYFSTAVDPASAAMSGRCPRCGEGRLFNGFVALNERCSNCDQSFKFADSGDGPAVFVILLAGFVIIALMFWVENSYEPPIWVHLVVFLPLTLITCLGLLRPLKGLMIGLQYKNKAEQGRLDQ